MELASPSLKKQQSENAQAINESASPNKKTWSYSFSPMKPLGEPLTLQKVDTGMTSTSKLEVRDFDKVTKLHCGAACMGKWCKHENWKNCDNPYIQGLHSDLIQGLLIGS